MIWYRDLFLGDSVRKSYKRIRFSAKTGLLNDKGFLITLGYGDNLLDVIDYREIRQKGYPKDTTIIGIAGSKEEGNELAINIINSYYRATGNLNIKEYFKAALNTM